MSRHVLEPEPYNKQILSQHVTAEHRHLFRRNNHRLIISDFRRSYSPATLEASPLGLWAMGRGTGLKVWVWAPGIRWISAGVTFRSEYSIFD